MDGWRARQRAAGLCLSCTARAVIIRGKQRDLCAEHLEARRLWQRAYRQRIKGRCLACAKPAAPERAYCAAHLERNRWYMVAYRRGRRTP